MSLRKKMFFGLFITAVVVSLIMFTSLQGFSKKGDDVEVRFERGDSMDVLQGKIQQMRQEIARKGYTFQVGVNPAVLVPIEELTGLKRDNLPEGFYLHENQPIPEVSSTMALPTSYTGYYTPIKDQGSCGSCWAFGTTAMVESAFLKANGTTYDFSEQYIVRCNTAGWDCNGGNWVFEMYMSPYGARLESCYPYTGTDGTCSTSCASVATITNWAYCSGNVNTFATTDQMKNAIYTYGAVASYVYADSYFQAYTSGCFNRTSTAITNHAIILCGWNDTTPCSSGAWLLKNSWGTSWGTTPPGGTQGGWMWLQYGCMGIGDGGAYVTVNTTPQAPVAAFTSNKTTVLVGGTVSFTDQSTNTPTSWSWTFNGGTPSTSTSQNPTITYNTLGTYSVTLTATNATGSNTLTKTNYITVTDTIPLTYCASASTNINDEWIAGVVVADLNHTSSGAYYSDFTSYTTHLTKGSSASLTLTPGYSGTAYNEYWAIWIDYNQNGVFTDSGEAVYSGSGTTAKTGSFTVPTTALTGNTRMRVSMKYNAAPTSCETFTYGEVEDYTANIATGTGAAPVANFTSNKTTVAIGGTVAFTDTSTNTPTSWAWTFTGGTPSTSTAQNPTITYNTAGTYTVALTATNAYGSNTITKTAYITVTSSTYCAAASTNTNDEWIARVRIGTIDKSSTKSYYSDFTATSTNLTRGASVTVTLNPGYTSTIYSEAWRLFIDYNKDYDFADTGETVFSKTGTSQQSGTFTVLSTAGTGATRLRVTMKYSTYTTACGSFTYGEVEDYTVNIL